MKKALLAFLATAILVGAFFRRTAQRDAVPNSYVTSKPEYRAAQPTWFGRAPKAFWDWLQSPEELSIKFRITITLMMIIVIIAYCCGVEALLSGTSPGQRGAFSGLGLL